MKKSLAFICLVTVLFATSCKKTISLPTYGSWSFKNTSYTANLNSVLTGFGGAQLEGITSVPSGGTTSNTLTVMFASSDLPTASGTYTVVSTGTGPAGNQVAITMETQTGTYNSTGTAGTVTVTVSGSSVKVSGSGIDMVNSTTSTDAGTLSISGLSN